MRDHSHSCMQWRPLVSPSEPRLTNRPVTLYLFAGQKTGKRERRGVMFPNTVQGGHVDTVTATHDCHRMVEFQLTFVFFHTFNFSTMNMHYL